MPSGSSDAVLQPERRGLLARVVSDEHQVPSTYADAPIGEAEVVTAALGEDASIHLGVERHAVTTLGHHRADGVVTSKAVHGIEATSVLAGWVSEVTFSIAKIL
jgi:hypothetical protein